MSQHISVYIGPFVSVTDAPNTRGSLLDLVDDELHSPDLSESAKGVVIFLPNHQRLGSGRIISEDSEAGVSSIAYGDREKEIAQFEDSFEQVLRKLRAIPGAFVKVQWGVTTYWS